MIEKERDKISLNLKKFFKKNLSFILINFSSKIDLEVVVASS